jgi:hypothetical protein
MAATRGSRYYLDRGNLPPTADSGARISQLRTPGLGELPSKSG